MIDLKQLPWAIGHLDLRQMPLHLLCTCTSDEKAPHWSQQLERRP